MQWNAYPKILLSLFLHLITVLFSLSSLVLQIKINNLLMHLLLWLRFNKVKSQSAEPPGIHTVNKRNIFKPHLQWGKNCSHFTWWKKKGAIPWESTAARLAKRYFTEQCSNTEIQAAHPFFFSFLFKNGESWHFKSNRKFQITFIAAAIKRIKLSSYFKSWI